MFGWVVKVPDIDWETLGGGDEEEVGWETTGVMWVPLFSPRVPRRGAKISESRVQTVSGRCPEAPPIGFG